MASNYKEIKILGYHSLPLNTYVYDNVENPKASVVIVHGMQEHAGRYKHFATFLNKQGYIVLANDLRGHGKTAPDRAHFGYGERNIFVESVIDEICIIKYAKEVYKLPVYLFGHSYGSMLSQSIIQHTRLVEKAVLCGTTDGSSFPIKLATFASGLLSTVKSKDKISHFVENVSIKQYGRKFENGNWLTKDTKVFEAYKKDKYCGGPFPFGFYFSLSHNMSKMNRHIKKIGDKKVLFIAGEKDPVGSNAKHVKSLHKRYVKAGIDASIKIYPNDRHELLNETNKDEVFADVARFYEK